MITIVIIIIIIITAINTSYYDTTDSANGGVKGFWTSGEWECF